MEAGAVHSLTLVKGVRPNAVVLPGVDSVRDWAESPARTRTAQYPPGPQEPEADITAPTSGVHRNRGREHLTRMERAGVWPVDVGTPC